MNSNKKYSRGKMILDFLSGAKRYFILAILFDGLAAFADMLRPKIIQYTVDGILGGDTSSIPGSVLSFLDRIGGLDSLLYRLWIPAAAVIAATLLSVCMRYFYQMNTVKGGESFVKNMRDQLFSHIQDLSTMWHSQHQTGDIIQRCTQDVDEVKGFLSDQLPSLITIVITIILSLVFMFRISFKLAMVSLISIPILVLFSFWFHQVIGRSFQQCDENEGLLSTIAQENLTGVRVVRAFGQERREQLRFLKQNEITTDKWIDLGKYLCSYWFFSDLLTGLLVLITLCWGSALCVSGRMTVGGLLAMISYLAMLTRPVRNMGRVLSEMSKTGVSINRLHEIMVSEPERDIPDAVTPPMDKDIDFNHVSYAYPGQPEILHDITMHIPAGSTLGILGNTGSGKSTLAHLLSRLYPLDPSNGTITVGGVDLQTIPADWVRQNVGFVLQEPFLFSRTIGENISIARPELGENGIHAAAASACLDKAIRDFPKGYDTTVGERGVTLSGGQKQRAAIARTLTLNTPILIFDDSLSAVDAETDALIRQNLKKHMKDTTVILISHRINTLMSADNIVVINDGRITDSGTHAELSSRPGLYQTICRIQMGEEADLDG